MLKNYRKRFVKYNMMLVGVVLLIAVIAQDLYLYRTSVQELQDTMRMIVQPWGMMNEDYVPHVDVFWRGLEELCSCIDHQVAVKFDEFLLCIDTETATTLENDIMSPKFVVDDAKIAKASEFQKKLSVEYQKVINRKKNGEDFYR